MGFVTLAGEGRLNGKLGSQNPVYKGFSASPAAF
jgi:hypothetical protein